MTDSENKKIFEFLAKSKTKTMTFEEFRKICHNSDGTSHEQLCGYHYDKILKLKDGCIGLDERGEFILAGFEDYFKQRDSGALLRSMLDQKSPKLSDSDNLTDEKKHLIMIQFDALKDKISEVYSGCIKKYNKSEKTYTYEFTKNGLQYNLNVKIDEKIDITITNPAVIFDKKHIDLDVDKVIRVLRRVFDCILETEHLEKNE